MSLCHLQESLHIVEYFYLKVSWDTCKQVSTAFQHVLNNHLHAPTEKIDFLTLFLITKICF